MGKALDLVKKLSSLKIKTNITAIFTKEQIKRVIDSIVDQTPAVISIFAGRIANTGLDPIPFMKYAVDLSKDNPEKEILWASPESPKYNPLKIVDVTLSL